MKSTCQNLDLFWLNTSALHAASSPRTVAPAYRVGEPLRGGLHHWPEGAQYHYGANGHELIIFRSDPDEQAIQGVRRGDAEFALIVRESILLLAFRFGGSGDWSDAPYCWHTQPAWARLTPPSEVSEESRALLWVTLVGARDGIIHAQRGLTLAPEFTRALQSAIRRQAQSRFRSDDCLAAVSDLLLGHPSTAHRLPLACARTNGNQ
ncbi:MAG: hypothetical protein U0790_08715 [Isosphaeraceae bacterium]